MSGVWLFIFMCVLMAFGLPISVSLGMSAVIALLLGGNISLIAVTQRMLVGVDSFPLLAIIFFMVAGELMMQGGISKRLVKLAQCFLAGVRGSLALISFVTCAFFGALSGSTLATAAAVGAVMYPEMLKSGDYDKEFALTIQAVGGTLGAMIPPSVPMVIYGMLTNTSIGDLFMAIALPGILVCILYCIWGYIIIKKRNMAVNQKVVKVSVLHAFLDGIWALITPLIILGGIYAGIFSPTESAAVACLYALIVGLFVYKELNMKNIFKAFYTAMEGSAGIMFLVSCATLFGWVLTRQGFPELVAGFLNSVINSEMMFLVVMNVVFLIAGMFIDPTTTQLLMIPLVLPTAVALNVNMVHLGASLAVNMCLGTITPPFGACLFVASTLDRSIKIESIYKEAIPFCIAGVVGIIIVILVPQLSTWML